VLSMDLMETRKGVSDEKSAIHGVDGDTKRGFRRKKALSMGLMEVGEEGTSEKKRYP
jgi:hypothetical protein